jgi:hypothetical protein
MKKVINFIPSDELTENIIDHPIPSKSVLPDWYKKLHFKNNKNNLWRNPDGSSNLTIKGCVPVFDTLTSGYIITLPCDVYVNNNQEYVSRFMWEVSWDVVGTHDKFQYGEMKIPDGFEEHPYRWNTKWNIKTPNGYSLLFLHPQYRFDLPFITLTGIVDTDIYELPLNLPFLIKEGFEGMISKGTPIAQVIPIKRDNWKSNIEKFSKSQKYAIDKLKSIIERSYKKTVWSKKTYE